MQKITRARQTEQARQRERARKITRARKTNRRRTATSPARAAPSSLPARPGTEPVGAAPPSPPPRPALDDAERRLLEIARHLTDLGREPEALPRALRILADAHAPDGALPGVFFAAWAQSRDDKTAALALAWAREQVRLALQELVERGPRLPPRRAPSPETLAWLLLAGTEAICQEPPSAVADRLRALLELAGYGEPWPIRPSAPFGSSEVR